MTTLIVVLEQARSIYFQVGKEFIGRCMKLPTKEDGGNAFVQEVFSRRPLSFSIIFTRSARDCACIFSIARLR